MIDLNKSEEFVYNLCKNSFLSLWSYPNPKGKGNEELCDILVVCGQNIVIISVKEIHPTNRGDTAIDWERWQKKAIKKSCGQIYGAEHWINVAPRVRTEKGERGLPFPDRSIRKIYRVAIALGGNGKMPIYFGDFGKGFVHVFDEKSFDAIIKELDTIKDFIKYLEDKEAFIRTGKEIIFDGHEEDLLASYLHSDRKFPEDCDCLIIGDDLWEKLTERPEYIAKKEEDKISYLWDRLIEELCRNFYEGTLVSGNNLSEIDTVTRIMANEDRFSRRILSKDFMDFMRLNQEKKTRSRCVPCASGINYVFLACPRAEKREERVAELAARCHVARGLNQDQKTVIGIATEEYDPRNGFSLDVIYYFKEIWSEKDAKQMDYLQKDCKLFTKPRITHAHEDEYPTT